MGGYFSEDVGIKEEERPTVELFPWDHLNDEFNGRYECDAWKKIHSKYVAKFSNSFNYRDNDKYKKEIKKCFLELMLNCISSYDLVNELFKYCYSFDEVKKQAEIVIDKHKQEYLEKLRTVYENHFLGKMRLSKEMEKDIERFSGDIKESYEKANSCLNLPIDFRRLFPELRQSLITEVFGCSFDTSKNTNKLFNDFMSIINHFYKNKKCVFCDRVEKKMNILKNELKLTDYEINYLFMSFNDVPFPKVLSLSDIKNLIKFGICDEHGHFYPESVSWIYKYITGEVKSISDALISSEVLKLNEDIDISDYPIPMQKKINNVVNLINNYKGKSPLNILLWGESGCGKSTLVHLLQKHISSYKFVKINNKLLEKNKRIRSDFNEQRREGDYDTKATLRMKELNICAGVACNKNFVFVMDEADDVLNSSNGTTDNWLTGKKEVNELLENIRVPVIWVINHKDKIDKSTCRRFQYSIKFERLNVNQREKVWKKQISITKTENLMKDVDVKRFASKYDLTPGVISVALTNLKSLRPKKHEIETVLENLIENHLDLVEEYEIKDSKAANNDKYEITGLNIKSQFTLDKIVPAIRKFEEDKKSNKTKNRNLCLLFNGPPGTGKTEFVKYIARELKKELHYIVYSDVASCWVGETEKMIRNAFEKAEKDNAILFFDEADSLISNRENAMHSWEITQTSEILTRMERFNGIFVASTNFLKSVDNAAMRRFQFKLEFDYLKNDGKEIFYERFFNKKIEKKSRLDKIEKLTPGDFKAVRDRLNFLEDDPSEEMIIYELEQEVKYKSNNKSIGFNI